MSKIMEVWIGQDETSVFIDGKEFNAVPTVVNVEVQDGDDVISVSIEELVDSYKRIKQIEDATHEERRCVRKGDFVNEYVDLH